MQRKLKNCSVCNVPSVLWVSNPPMCRDCSQRLKMSLKQTEGNTVAKPFKVIPKVSSKQAKLNAAYSIKASLFKKNHPVCKAHIKCGGRPTTDIHHKRGRGEYLLDESTWLPVCRLCHNWINENNEEATRLGFSESRLNKTI